MANVHGWLFLDEKRTRIRFIEDSSASLSGLDVDWSLLLSDNRLEHFVEEFKLVPTREGPLSGWRVDTDLQQIHKWLQDRNAPTID
jgi:hypothetical protein